ncbi:MAG: radical SAM family heme chaperone HemW [Bacilli bacterium]|nr:radical SAM family heme chaperone HemW [Bacilli bacterium]
MDYIYIHIPFCDNICSYCDFCKFYYNESFIDRYLDNLSSEINSNYHGSLVKTIYVGGGTPSCLNLGQLRRLFDIISRFNLCFDYEFTFECNIESVNFDKLKFLYDNGVNRLSFGVQTFGDKFLKFLNRNHSKAMVFDIISMATSIGFNNINVDLMYAFPFETLSDLAYDIDVFLSLGVSHISTYSLIIEEHTKLYIDGVESIDDAIDRKMYDFICDKLCSYGYVHYEVSNFAIDGYCSKHNLNYWNNGEYYGFGCGASGYIDGVRYDNTRSLNRYLGGNYLFSYDIMDLNTRIENEFILGFRKINGINICDFNQKYGNIFKYDVINKLVKEGKLINDGISIYINPSYIYTSNSILVDLIGEKYE